MSLMEFVLNGLFIAVIITLPILAVLQQLKSLLDEIRETQKETNRLLRRYVTDERNDTG